MTTYFPVFKDGTAVNGGGEIDQLLRGVRPNLVFGRSFFRLLFCRGLFVIILINAFAGCRRKTSTHAVSFYFWRTRFQLSDAEKAALRNDKVKALYTRYFDIDFAPEDSAPHPLAPIVFPDTAAIAVRLPGGSNRDSLQIVPVVFIRNRVFEKLDSSGVYRLATMILSLSTTISTTGNIRTSAVQFDCDWTEKTRERYFLFLRDWRALSNQTVSVTVRLHQVKYPDRTGVPPVDKGVLMYYNMGNINAGNQRSIYDKSIADKYIPSLKTYPLTLDIALPIFRWGLLIRRDKVVQLLEKMDFSVFEKDSTFSVLKKDRYRVKHSCFKGGFYFQENDEIKIESVGQEELEEIVSQVNKYTNRRIGDLIFYDLDDSNLFRYEKNSFKKIRDLAD